MSERVSCPDCNQSMLVNRIKTKPDSKQASKSPGIECTCPGCGRPILQLFTCPSCNQMNIVDLTSPGIVGGRCVCGVKLKHRLPQSELVPA